MMTREMQMLALSRYLELLEGISVDANGEENCRDNNEKAHKAGAVGRVGELLSRGRGRAAGCRRRGKWRRKPTLWRTV